MNSMCFDCGATLNQKSPAIWTCSNADCPAGTAKHLCGYCRESSFSPTTGICANHACRTHKIARSTCSTCLYQSVLSLGGMTFCLNRLCPTHAGWVTACQTCSNESLIQLDGTGVCVKSTCANLLYLVPWPASLGSKRGLGGNPPPAESGAGRDAPGTAALRRSADVGVAGDSGLKTSPRYLADPNASTVIPGGSRAVSGHVSRPADPRFAVDSDAATVIPGVTASAMALQGIDEKAETVLSPLFKPKRVDEKAETEVSPPLKPKEFPAGFDENAETVLSPPPRLKGWFPADFNENAETVMDPPPKA